MTFLSKISPNIASTGRPKAALRSALGALAKKRSAAR